MIKKRLASHTRDYHVSIASGVSVFHKLNQEKHRRGTSRMIDVCGSIARSLHFTHSLKDLARKCYLAGKKERFLQEMHY